MRRCSSLWSLTSLLVALCALDLTAQPSARAQPNPLQPDEAQPSEAPPNAPAPYEAQPSQAQWSQGQPLPNPTPSSGQAQTGSRESELRARLVALQRSQRLDDSVRRPLELAASALEREKQRAAAGDRDGAARAERVASVALELAEARLRLLGEQALERGSAARRRAAEASEGRAREALGREQERARELARTSATP